MMTKERFRALIIDAIKKQDDDKIEQFSELLFEQYEKGTDLDGKQRVTEMTLRELIIEMRKGFEAVDKRFEAVDKRFEMLTHQMDKRFEELAHQMDKRFEMLTHTMDKRFEAVDKRFEDMNKRFSFLTWFIAAGLVTTNILIALLKIF